MILTVTKVWPPAIPLPMVDYSGEPRNSTIASPDKDTIVLRRSRFGRSYASLAVTWTLTAAQYTAFKSFYVNDLGCGASQFMVELRYPQNSALSEWAVRIANGFEASYQDGMWVVMGVLDIVNPVTF